MSDDVNHDAISKILGSEMKKVDRPQFGGLGLPSVTRLSPHGESIANGLEAFAEFLERGGTVEDWPKAHEKPKGGAA